VGVLVLAARQEE
jgi:hypothetical protein